MGNRVSRKSDSKHRRRSFSNYPRSHRIVEDGSVEDLKRFIEKGGNINESDSSGLTALHCAILNNDELAVKLLLDAGSDLKPCQLYLTPIHFAVQTGNVNIVRMLINHGESVNISDVLGNTPLLLAVEFNHLNVARLLIFKGAYVTAKNVLMAVENGFLEMTKLLIVTRPSVVHELKLSKYRFTRRSCSSLKLLVHAGFRFNWCQFVEHCRPLDLQELILGTEILMPPPHYNREADHAAFLEFKNWLHLVTSNPLSLQTLSLISFYKLCGNRSVERMLNYYCLPKRIRSFLLLDIPLT